VQYTYGTYKVGTSKSSLANVNVFPAIFINVKDGFGLNFTVDGIGYSSSSLSVGSTSNSFNLTFAGVLVLVLVFQRILKPVRKNKPCYHTNAFCYWQSVFLL